MIPNVRKILSNKIKVKSDQIIAPFDVFPCTNPEAKSIDERLEIKSEFHTNNTEADLIIYVVVVNKRKSYKAFAYKCALGKITIIMFNRRLCLSATSGRLHCPQRALHKV